MNQHAQTQHKLEVLTKDNPNLLDEIVKITEIKQKEEKLSDWLSDRAEKLWQIAADTLRMSDRERYLTRLASAIASDEKLAPCFDTNKGKTSIVQVMQKAVELGVMPGEDAYIIPYGQDRKKQPNGQWQYTWYKADLQLRAEAYLKILLSEPNPLFQDVRYDLVYENDNLTIDSGVGIIQHSISPIKGGRGDMIGVWIKFEPFPNSGRQPIVKYWDIERVHRVRDKHSATWQSYLEDKQLYEDCVAGHIKNAQKFDKSGDYKIPDFYGQGRDKWVKSPEKASNPWITDEEQMIYKTIIKGESKRFAAIKPGLAKVEIETQVIEEESGIVGKAFDAIDRGIDQFDEEKSQILEEEVAEEDEFLSGVFENES
jgi:recombinational DNA repair protein RecT